MDESNDAWGEEPDWAKENEFGDISNKEHDYGNDDEEFGTFGAHHILVLIDCDSEMFEPTECQSTYQHQYQSKSNSCAFDAAIEATSELLTQCIRDVATSKASKRNGVGVMLYGTKYFHDLDRRGDLSSNYNLIQMEPPGIQQIQHMQKCISKERNLQNEFQNRGESNMSQNVNQILGMLPLRSALHSANKIFQNARCVGKNKTSTDAKTVWIFTNQDDPCGNNKSGSSNNTRKKDEFEKFLVMAKDVTENGIQIHVYPFPKANISKNEHNFFDRTKFYDFFTTTTSLNNSTTMPSASFDINHFLEEIIQQWKKIRKIVTLPFLLPGYNPSNTKPSDSTTSILSSNTNMYLDLYRPISTQKPRGVTVNKKNNKITHRTTQMIAKETGGLVKDNDKKLSTYMLFANRHRVPITEHEVTMIKRYSHCHPQSTPSLILLGFKSSNSVPLFHTMDRAYFAYPNEDNPPRYGSSILAVSALYHSMMRKNVIGIGELLIRDTAVSRLVAIAPQREEISKEGGQIWPPGFVLSFLPFQNDIRYSLREPFKIEEKDVPGLKNSNCVPKEVLDAACDLIRHQHASESIDWDCDIPNPMIRKFWNYIEHIALGFVNENEDEDEDEDDVLNLQKEQILKTAGTQIKEFERSLPREKKDEDIGRNSRDSKRLRKSRLEKEYTESNLNDWMRVYKDNELDYCNIKELRFFLRNIEGEKNIAGNKAELLRRVRFSIENHIKSGKLNFN